MTIFHDLRATTSRIEKENILKSATEVERKILKYVYHPDWMYHHRFNTINWNTLVLGDTQYMFGLLNQMKNKEIVGNDSLHLINNYSYTWGDLIKLICNKDLDCGITATTINKVFPGLVPQFKVQLAKEIEIDKIRLPAIGQIKYNGTRVIAKKKGKEVKLYTRNGKTFDFPTLQNYIAHYHTDIVLDGELCFGDSSGSDHTKVSGLVNSAIHGNPIRNKDLVYHVFDAMSVGDFNHSKCDIQYQMRFMMAEAAILWLDEYYSNENNKGLVRKAYTKGFSSHEAINEYFTEVLEQGFEGLIIKHWDHMYEFKRSKAWAKLKETRTVDLECINWEEGKGKYEGQIGKLVCKGVVEGKQVVVRVGSGLTDALRAKEPIFFLGKIIEIDYNTTILNYETGEWSLFLPRYITLRGDLS